MISDDLTLINDLLQESEHAMLGAVARLKELSSTNAEERAAFVASFAIALNTSTLGEYERQLRLKRVVALLRLDRAGLAQLASSARSLGPGMQASVAGMLPADLKLTAYEALGQYSASDTGPNLKYEADQRPVPNSGALASELCEELSETFPNVTVLLLSAIDQEANRRLIEGEGLQVVNVGSVQELDQWLIGSADICAFVVDRSFLSALSVADQTDLTRKLASYSTFVWIRIDGSGTELRLSDEEVFSIARECRCRLSQLCNHDLLVANTSNLHERELPYLRRAAHLLEHPPDGLVTLRNLDALALQVMVAASATYAEERFGISIGQVAEIGVTLLQGGRSGDQVFVVQIDKRGKPILAKIGSMRSVAEEAKRFRHFLQETYDFVPQLHFHRGAALLICPLYSDESEPFEPAPTLESCLRNLWLKESGFLSDDLLLSEIEFREVISTAIRKLKNLNRKFPPVSEYRTTLPALLDPIHTLETNHVTWGFDPSVLKSRSNALEIAGSLDSTATVHGDLQFRNILVTSRADCELIDFPGAGPGHPGSDLARMELFFFSAILKQTVDHLEMARFQTALSLDRLTLDQLSVEFPSLAACQLNRVCVHGCVGARDAAIALVEAKGGSHRDYLAIKLLTAWQMLAMDEMNHGATRAVISAISPAILK